MKGYILYRFRLRPSTLSFLPPPPSTFKDQIITQNNNNKERQAANIPFPKQQAGAYQPKAMGGPKSLFSGQSVMGSKRAHSKVSHIHHPRSETNDTRQPYSASGAGHSVSRRHHPWSETSNNRQPYLTSETGHSRTPSRSNHRHRSTTSRPSRWDDNNDTVLPSDSITQVAS